LKAKKIGSACSFGLQFCALQGSEARSIQGHRNDQQINGLRSEVAVEQATKSRRFPGWLRPALAQGKDKDTRDNLFPLIEDSVRERKSKFYAAFAVPDCKLLILRWLFQYGKIGKDLSFLSGGRRRASLAGGGCLLGAGRFER
jgi:hypothetical protein